MSISYIEFTVKTVWHCGQPYRARASQLVISLKTCFSAFSFRIQESFSGNMESGKRGQVARKEHAKGNAQPDIIKTFEAGYT